MSKGIKLFLAAVFIILLNVGLFSFASISLTSFWISWVFIHIAFVITVCILVLSVSEQKKLFFAYSESAITTYYFLIELVAGLVMIFQFAFLPVVAFVVQMIILAAFGMAFVSTKMMNKNIDREEKVREVELYQFKSLLESMKDVQMQIDYSAPYKKIVEHAYDAMAASQVKSSPEVREIEQYIMELIGQLKQSVIAGDEKEVCDLCKSIENAVAKRNRELRIKRA